MCLLPSGQHFLWSLLILRQVTRQAPLLLVSMPSNNSLATVRTSNRQKNIKLGSRTERGMKLTTSMSETLFQCVVATHTLLVYVTVKIHRSIHVRWLTLAHVLDVRSFLTDATASQMSIDFSPKLSYFDSAFLVFVALEPAEMIRSCIDSPIDIEPVAKI